MTDLEILSAYEKAAETSIELMLEDTLPREEGDLMQHLRIERINKLRERLTGMITLAWQTGYEMGWQVGRKELLGDGETVPSPEDIQRMMDNLEKAKKEK